MVYIVLVFGLFVSLLIFTGLTTSEHPDVPKVLKPAQYALRKTLQEEGEESDEDPYRRTDKDAEVTMSMPLERWTFRSIRLISPCALEVVYIDGHRNIRKVRNESKIRTDWYDAETMARCDKYDSELLTNTLIEHGYWEYKNERTQAY